MFETYPRTLRTDRLFRLAQKIDGSGPYLEAGPIPREKWTMREWFVWTIGPPRIDPNDPAFVACPIGWAATDPWFRVQGLQIRDLGYKSAPAYEGHLGFCAVQLFFGLTPTEGDHLFWIGDYDGMTPGPDVVAGRIYEFIGRNFMRAAA